MSAMSPVSKFVFEDGTAVVTGAASGIGEALAHGLARRGSNLVLVDRDAGRLHDVATAIAAGERPPDVSTHVVDLADPEATTVLAETIRSLHPRIRLLVNNAGVGLSGRFDQVTFEEFNWVVDVNFRAVVQLTHMLLPALKAETGSHIANMSSLFGIMASPGQAAYCASKFAVRGFSEALRLELAQDGIGVTSIHPGGVRTRIAESARRGSGVPPEEHELGSREFSKLLRMAPADAAEVILSGIERRRGRVLVGRDAKTFDFVARLLPASYGKVLAALISKAIPKSVRQLGAEDRPTLASHTTEPR
jgi:short-subunit dehydrogenase